MDWGTGLGHKQQKALEKEPFVAEDEDQKEPGLRTWLVEPKSVEIE